MNRRPDLQSKMTIAGSLCMHPPAMLQTRFNAEESQKPRFMKSNYQLSYVVPSSTMEFTVLQADQHKGFKNMLVGVTFLENLTRSIMRDMSCVVFDLVGFKLNQGRWHDGFASLPKVDVGTKIGIDMHDETMHVYIDNVYFNKVNVGPGRHNCCAEVLWFEQRGEISYPWWIPVEPVVFEKYNPNEVANKKRKTLEDDFLENVLFCLHKASDRHTESAALPEEPLAKRACVIREDMLALSRE